MMKFLRSLLPNHIPENSPRHEVAVLRETILQSIYLIIGPLGLVIYMAVVPADLKAGRIFPVIFFTIFLVLIWISLCVRSISYQIRVYVLLSIVYILANASLVMSGLSGNGIMLIASFILFTIFLVGKRAAIILSLISAVTLLMIGFLISAGQIAAPSTEIQSTSSSFIEWAHRAVILFLLALFGSLCFNYYVNRLEIALVSQKKKAEDLAVELTVMHERVQTFSIELDGKTKTIASTSLIARDISQNNDLSHLLSNAVEMIKKEYHLYYAAIFLLDDNKENAILKAGTGEAGLAMLARNHSFKLDSASFVGQAAAQKQIILSQNVEREITHYKNPFLPDTKSELSIPLILQDEVIGVLDVQSENTNFFSPIDLQALQITADQLAVGVKRAQLEDQLTTTVESLKENYRQSTVQSWQNFYRSTKRTFAYKYSNGQIDLVNETSALAQKAIQSGNMEIEKVHQPEKSSPSSRVAFPIILRGQIIGVIDLSVKTENLPKNQIELIKAASDRLATSLENARLLEEIQMRAARDRMISQISAKVRSESEIDKVLQTVAAELGRSLEVSDVLVQLRSA